MVGDRNGQIYRGLETQAGRVALAVAAAAGMAVTVAVAVIGTEIETEVKEKAEIEKETRVRKQVRDHCQSSGLSSETTPGKRSTGVE